MTLVDCDSNFVFINAQQYRPMHIIPEQFTVKTHQALFEGDSKGCTTIPVYIWHTHSKLEKSHKKALKHHNFEQSVGDHHQKCWKVQ